MKVEIVDEKRVRISRLDPVVGQCLQEVPTILEKREDRRAQQRLFPPPTKDEEKANHDWQELMVPELRHLFVAAGEILGRDLIALEPEPARTTETTTLRPVTLQVTFLAEHLPAWMSALNEARLILGALYEVEETDMNDYDSDWHTAKRQAVLKIHVLAEVLEHLVRFELGETD